METESAPAPEPIGKKPENTWAMLCHLVLLSSLLPLGAFIQFCLPYGGVFFIWALKKEDENVRENARQALNWHLTVMLVGILMFAVLIACYLWHQQEVGLHTKLLQLRLEQAATDPEKNRALNEMRQHIDGMQGWVGMVSLPIILGSGLILAFAITNIYQVIRNSVRAFRGEEVRYPFSVPLFQVKNKRGWLP